MFFAVVLYRTTRKRDSPILRIAIREANHNVLSLARGVARGLASHPTALGLGDEALDVAELFPEGGVCG